MDKNSPFVKECVDKCRTQIRTIMYKVVQENIHSALGIKTDWGRIEPEGWSSNAAIVRYVSDFLGAEAISHIKKHISTLLFSDKLEKKVSELKYSVNEYDVKSFIRESISEFAKTRAKEHYNEAIKIAVHEMSKRDLSSP